MQNSEALQQPLLAQEAAGEIFKKNQDLDITNDAVLNTGKEKIYDLNNEDDKQTIKARLLEVLRKKAQKGQDPIEMELISILQSVNCHESRFENNTAIPLSDLEKSKNQLSELKNLMKDIFTEEHLNEFLRKFYILPWESSDRYAMKQNFMNASVVVYSVMTKFIAAAVAKIGNLEKMVEKLQEDVSEIKLQNIKSEEKHEIERVKHEAERVKHEAERKIARKIRIKQVVEKVFLKKQAKKEKQKHQAERLADQQKYEQNRLEDQQKYEQNRLEDQRRHQQEREEDRQKRLEDQHKYEQNQQKHQQEREEDRQKYEQNQQKYEQDKLNNEERLNFMMKLMLGMSGLNPTDVNKIELPKLKQLGKDSNDEQMVEKSTTVSFHSTDREYNKKVKADVNKLPVALAESKSLTQSSFNQLKQKSQQVEEEKTDDIQPRKFSNTTEVTEYPESNHKRSSSWENQIQQQKQQEQMCFSSGEYTVIGGSSNIG